MSETVKDRIKELMKKENINAKDLEEKLGFGNGIISKYNQFAPSSDNLLKLSRYFNVSPYYIMYGEEYENTPVTDDERKSKLDDIYKELSAVSTDKLDTAISMIKFIAAQK